MGSGIVLTLAMIGCAFMSYFLAELWREAHKTCSFSWDVSAASRHAGPGKKTLYCRCTQRRIVARRKEHALGIADQLPRRGEV